MRDKVYELVLLTHQRSDALVSDNERVVVTGSTRSVGPSASLAPMPAQRCYRWTDIGTAVATLWQQSVLLLPGEGLHLRRGIMGGGVWQYTRTPVLHVHADR